MAFLITAAGQGDLDNGLIIRADSATSDSPASAPTEASAAAETTAAQQPAPTAPAVATSTYVTSAADGAKTTVVDTVRTVLPPTVATVVTEVQTVDGSSIPVTSTATPPPNAAGETNSPTAGNSGKSNDSGSSGGLSSGNKKVIIGVVVGVGGAILLAAVGLVVWRVARRRHGRHGDEVDDLMSGTALGATSGEKTPSPRHSAPFQHTLDQYHNPPQVNAASNF